MGSQLAQVDRSRGRFREEDADVLAEHRIRYADRNRATYTTKSVRYRLNLVRTHPMAADLQERFPSADDVQVTVRIAVT